MSGRTAFDVDLARTLIDRKRTMPGATLPILHDLLEQFGYIDDGAIPLIADALNISRAEALGVVSFYHDFRRSPIDGPGPEAVPRRILSGHGMRRPRFPSRRQPRRHG